MKLEKKHRLEAAGWKETTVKEFLNLSEADAQYIETKLALSRRLRQLREQPHLTQTKAASLLKTSQSRLARMEAGDPSVSSGPAGARSICLGSILEGPRQGLTDTISGGESHFCESG